MRPRHTAVSFVVLLGIALCAAFLPAVASAEPTLVVRWNDVLLQCVRVSKIGPPMVARAIAITHTCGYDAWAMYDDVAIATRLGPDQRRPPSERTEANKKAAFSYAEYHALLDLFPDQAPYIRSQMTALGYDPDASSEDATSPVGMGTRCALAVTTYRHGDGSNQLGDLHPGAYSDYTGYAPVNTLDEIKDPNRWQPLRFCDGKGGFVNPSYVAPQWGNVVPFALASWDQFHLGPPERYPHGGYVAQAEEIIRLNAQIDDRQKMIAEFWADGPRSELPPGHWTLFAEFVSNRDHHTFDQDVKLFFTLGNAVMDAGIAVWGTKREYDSERPITAIHYLKAGKKILAYVPFEGRKVINGEDWAPYQPCSFVTPPFPEYPSGHSAFSSAAAEILKRFTGSDALGASVTFAAGSGRVEPGFAPAHDVTLSWATFSEAADEAGMSRRYGGIHFEEGDLNSRRLGRQVGGAVWDKAQQYINGTLVAAGAAGASMLQESASLAKPAASQPTFALAAVVPNPGPGGFHFGFTVATRSRVTLSVTDVAGRRVAVVADGIYDAGPHTVVWAGDVPAGIYFLHDQAPTGTLVRRFAVIR